MADRYLTKGEIDTIEVGGRSFRISCGIAPGPPDEGVQELALQPGERGVLSAGDEKLIVHCIGPRSPFPDNLVGYRIDVEPDVGAERAGPGPDEPAGDEPAQGGAP